MKTCKRCLKTKPKRWFYKRTHGGHYWICKTCFNFIKRQQYKQADNKKYSRSRVMRQFGWSDEDYNRMLELQGGVCKICQLKGKERLSVDHDHEADKIRALLCKNCNSGLGMFKDDPALLLRAIEYLHDHGR